MESIGYRFHPTDKQIITHYLEKKIANNSAKVPHIHDVDICNFEPWQLSEQYPPAVNPNDQVWYFYHPISYGSNIKRTTNTGSWKITGKDLVIRDEQTGEVIGTRKILVYHNGHGSNATRTPWVIHEFHSNRTPPSNKKAFVVCRLKRN